MHALGFLRRVFGTLLGPLFLAFALYSDVSIAAPDGVSNSAPDSTPVRYMALGDSLSAGFKVIPVTGGFTFQLYKQGVFAPLADIFFNNAAVPGATSQDLLYYQVPQAINLFKPDRVTITVGGNDLLTLLGAAPPDPAQVEAVLGKFAINLQQTLFALCVGLPDGAHLYLGNLYTIPQIPGADQVVPLFNSVMSGVVNEISQVTVCLDNVIRVADVYNAFLGRRGLLLIERPGAAPNEVHPTKAGHAAIARAFKEQILGH